MNPFALLFSTHISRGLFAIAILMCTSSCSLLSGPLSTHEGVSVNSGLTYWEDLRVTELRGYYDANLASFRTSSNGFRFDALDGNGTVQTSGLGEMNQEQFHLEFSEFREVHGFTFCKNGARLCETFARSTLESVLSDPRQLRVHLDIASILYTDSESDMGIASIWHETWTFNRNEIRIPSILGDIGRVLSFFFENFESGAKAALLSDVAHIKFLTHYAIE